MLVSLKSQLRMSFDYKDTGLHVIYVGLDVPLED